DQAQSSNVIARAAEAVPLPKDLDDDSEDEKSTSPWRYHNNNDGAIFTITSHLADHILTKVQGLEPAKLMYNMLEVEPKWGSNLENLGAVELQYSHGRRTDA